ncbi:unnamed protein product [Parajaminaea phylloscopi]
MPRSSRSSGGRPSSSSSRGPSAFGSSSGQSRGAHTATHPQSYHPPQSHAAPHAPAGAAAPAAAAPSAGPGLFGQMASTAAGVAVGSTVGHGLSSMLFGGGSRASEQVPAEHAQAADFAQAQAEGQRVGGVNCEVQSKDFLRCLEATSNDVNTCSFYLEQLKQCQAAARPY